MSPDRPEIRREWLRVELLAPPAAEEAWQLCTPALTPLGALSYTMQRRVAAGEAPEGGEFLTALAARVASLDRAAFPPALARVAAAREVALVGNGSGTRGRGLAAEIEAHDAVVRINYPMLTGFEADVGARSDAMVFAEEKRPDLPVLMAREPGHPSHPAMSLRTAARRADPALRPPAVPPGIGPLVAEITYERPTTGFFATILIALLLRRPFTLYGFDFFRPDAQGHYFGTATGALRHELAYERWFTGAVLPVLFPGLRRVE